MRVAVLIIFISLSTSMAKAGDPTENDYHGSNRAHEIQPAGFDRALSTISPKVCRQEEGQPVPFQTDTCTRECDRFSTVNENNELRDILLFTDARNHCPCETDTVPLFCPVVHTDENSVPEPCVNQPAGTRVDVRVCGSYQQNFGMLAYQQYCASKFDCVRHENHSEFTGYRVALKEFLQKLQNIQNQFENSNPQDLVKLLKLEHEQFQTKALVGNANACLEGCAVFVAGSCCQDEIKELSNEKLSFQQDQTKTWQASQGPTQSQTGSPSSAPSFQPSKISALDHGEQPSTMASPSTPTYSVKASISPSISISVHSSASPALPLSEEASEVPSQSPSTQPSSAPTISSNPPSDFPSLLPTLIPTDSTSGIPSFLPTIVESSPSEILSIPPTDAPSAIATTTPLNCTRDNSAQWIENPVFDLLDVLDDGKSPGDVYLFEDNVIRSGNSDVIGKSSGRCTLLSDVSSWYCSILVSIYDQGSIVLQGERNLQIVGGVECFQGASGFVQLEFDAQNHTYDVELFDGFHSYQQHDKYMGPWAEVINHHEFIDWNGDGPSSGDTIVFQNKTLLSADGYEGTVVGECMILKHVNASQHFCTITFAFGDDSDDELVVMGLAENMVVVGGTGYFEGRSGQVSGVLNSRSLDYVVSFDDSENGSCASGLFDNTWSEASGDVFVDYGNDHLSPGDGFVFDNSTVSIPTATGTIHAISDGRCMALQDLIRTYCTITFTLAEGTFAVTGFFDSMVITGGTGCFKDLSGLMRGTNTATGFEYTFSFISTVP